jgi:acylpyruvate hydrolase
MATVQKTREWPVIRFASFKSDEGRGLAVDLGEGFRGLRECDRGYPGDLPTLLALGSDLIAVAQSFRAAPALDLETVELLPPIPYPPKIICVGLNYIDHAAEGHFDIPTYPSIFARFSSSLIGHGAAIVRPQISEQLDFEGEVAAIIGMEGRNIPESEALLHVAGYSIFNDASIRDFQFRTTQWTAGKNFDATGAFGPYFVPASQLPPGAKGLRLQTRLNGSVVQDASTSDMIFDVAKQISLLSEAFTLQPGDVIVTGTPAGVGFARTPPLWMKPCDVIEVELEGVGTLRNTVVQGD